MPQKDNLFIQWKFTFPQKGANNTKLEYLSMSMIAVSTLSKSSVKSKE